MSRLSVILLVFAGVAGLAGAQTAGSLADLELVPQDIVGVTLYPDGQTPIIDLPVRVWSVDKDKIIYRTRTDKDGAFKIPGLTTGRCFVFVGRVKVDMRVLAGRKELVAQQANWIVIMPRGLLVSKTPEIYDLLMLTPTLTLPLGKPSSSSPVSTPTSPGGSTPKPEPPVPPPLEPPVVSP
jgi:hypothetical protein